MYTKDEEQTSLVSLLIVLFLYMIFAPDLFSATLPYEDTLTQISKSLSGPVAGIISVIAVVAGGVAFIFGNQAADSSNTIKLVGGLAFLMGLILGANAMVTHFGGTTSGALI